MSEWDSVFSADGIHYRPDNGEPIQVQVELMKKKDNVRNNSCFNSSSGMVISLDKELWINLSDMSKMSLF